MSFGVAAVVAGGSSLLGGVANYFGSQSAASSEANAANNAAATQQQMFNTEQQNAQPYMQAGTQALSQLQNNMGYYNQPYTQAQFQQDPGYQFDLQQGQKALQTSSAASGGIMSGSELASLNNYSQNMASNEYQNAFNNYQTQVSNSYNRLAGVAGMGAQTVASLNGQATQSGANIGNSLTSAGNAQAAGAVGSSNAISGALSGVGNAVSSYGIGNAIMNKTQTPSMGIGGSGGLQMPQIGSQYASSGGTAGLLAGI